jgi:integrase
MGITKSPKSQKGTVVLESFRGRLRLRWRHASKRYALALEYPDDKPHRKLAEARAREIQADLDLDRFDVTLNKYKRQGQLSESSESTQFTLRELWE